jgi:hypothetical protein
MKDRFTLLVAASLTALFCLTAGGLVLFGTGTALETRLIDTCITLATGGALGIFALLNSEGSNRRRRR